MILDELVAVTRKRVAREQAARPLAELQAQVTGLSLTVDRPFETALRRPGLSVIGEVKQTSPSRGIIVTDFNYRQIARDYQAAGIDAISVLTEPDYFHGKLQYLQEIHQDVTTPLLRKDFTIDAYQLYQAKLAGASAVLLIVAILSPHQLREYLKLADQLGLSAIVEAHDAAEIQQAVTAGARIVGINNRNLKDFTVDFTNSTRLRALIPADCLAIAESGVQNAADMQRLTAAGFDAVLIGTTLMQAPDKAAALAALRQEGVPDDQD